MIVNDRNDYMTLYIIQRNWDASLSDEPTWHPHMLEFSQVFPSPCRLHAESAVKIGACRFVNVQGVKQCHVYEERCR